MFAASNLRKKLGWSDFEIGLCANQCHRVFPCVFVSLFDDYVVANVQNVSACLHQIWRRAGVRRGLIIAPRFSYSSFESDFKASCLSARRCSSLSFVCGGIVIIYFDSAWDQVHQYYTRCSERVMFIRFQLVSKFAFSVAALMCFLTCTGFRNGAMDQKCPANVGLKTEGTDSKLCICKCYLIIIIVFCYLLFMLKKSFVSLLFFKPRRKLIAANNKGISAKDK